MSSDPIQHLRELMAKASLPPNEATAELIRALPALLAVAEAARVYADALDAPLDWDDYSARKQVFIDALAKLDEVKP